MKRCPDCGYKGTLSPEAFRHDLDGVAVIDASRYVCPKCGAEHVGLSKMEGLYREVALELASLPRRLTADELRWLRKHLGYSTSEWAAYLGVQRETVSRWENGHQEVPLGTERLLRMLIKVGTHRDEYGTPLELKKGRVEKPAFRQNSAGQWVRI